MNLPQLEQSKLTQTAATRSPSRRPTSRTSRPNYLRTGTSLSVSTSTPSLLLRPVTRSKLHLRQPLPSGTSSLALPFPRSSGRAPTHLGWTGGRSSSPPPTRRASTRTCGMRRSSSPSSHSPTRPWVSGPRSPRGLLSSTTLWNGSRTRSGVAPRTRPWRKNTEGFAQWASPATMNTCVQWSLTFRRSSTSAALVLHRLALCTT